MLVDRGRHADGAGVACGGGAGGEVVWVAGNYEPSETNALPSFAERAPRTIGSAHPSTDHRGIRRPAVEQGDDLPSVLDCISRDHKDLARDPPFSRLSVQRRRLGQRYPPRHLERQHSAVDQRHQLPQLLGVTHHEHDY